LLRESVLRPNQPDQRSVELEEITMSRLVALAGAVAVTAGSAQAGNVDRSLQSSLMIFEPGGYAEFTLRRVSPDVSGIGAGTFPSPATPTPGQSSGDMSGGYNNFGAAVKTELQPGLDAGLIFDQPFGADTYYPTDTRYFGRGTVATLDTNALTALLKYRFESNVSIFGGLRYQTFEAAATIPFVTAVPGRTAPYTASADEDSGWGYVLGIAWEKPEIAARIALTYNSAIDYSLQTSETSFLGGLQSITEVSTPQSVNLDFETGIAEDTLLFGGVRWVDWTEFDISPAMYSQITRGRSLVSYESDTYTYTLGVGRRFTENWSGAVSASYEPQVGGYASNLGPTDGFTSVNVGGTYTQGPMEVSAGVSYIWIGSAETTISQTEPAANFEDNDGIGFGMRVAYRF
jgi:long-subunit fatty acid transport protein